MKNFFKKLAFVMALAMVITSLAPAAGVFAAKKPVLNAKSATLLLGNKKRATFDFNLNNKVKGSTYKWTTSDKKVATVKQNGVVTAVGNGTAKIKLAIKLPTGKTTPLTATVTVKTNAETVTITNLPEAAIKVGDTHNFNRSYTMLPGGVKTTDVTSFVITSENAAKAKITKGGNFTATETGEYTIQAVMAQSNSKLKAGTFTAKSEEVKVNVVNAIAEFKAVKSNTVQVTFAAPIEEAKVADYVITNSATSVKTYIKSATLSADKKSVDLVLFDVLTSGENYSLVANVAKTEMKAELKYVRGNVDKVVAANQIVKADTPSPIVYHVFDENGLDITADTVISFESSALITNGQITLYNGEIAYVTVVYTDFTNGNQIKSAQIIVTGSNATSTAIGDYTIANVNSADWNKIVTSINKSATGKYLYVRSTDQYGVVTTPAHDGTSVTFESLDTNILVVDKTTGEISPIAIGTGYVKVVIGNVTKIVAITVTDDSRPTTISASTAVSGSRTGHAYGLNKPVINVAVLDQFGNKMAGQTATLTYANATDIVTIDTPTQAINDWGTDFTLTTLKAGQTSIKVSVDGLTPKYVVVTVRPENVVATGTALDGLMKLNVAKGYGTDNYGATTTLKVYATNSTGDKIVQISGSDVAIKVTNPNGATTTVTGGEFALDVRTGVINHTTGTYNVVVESRNARVTGGSFVVEDTATAPVVTLNTNRISGSLSLSAIVNLLKYNSSVYTVTDVTYVSNNSAFVPSKLQFNGSSNIIGGGTATLSNVKVQLQNGEGRVYTITLGGNIFVTN